MLQDLHTTGIITDELFVNMDVDFDGICFRQTCQATTILL